MIAAWDATLLPDTDSDTYDATESDTDCIDSNDNLFNVNYAIISVMYFMMCMNWRTLIRGPGRSKPGLMR